MSRRAPATAAAAALVLAALVPVLAQRQSPPAPGTPRDITLPTPQAFTLDNGLEVTLLPFGTVPKAAVQLVVRAGNVDEGPGDVWLADLMGDLMREGTASRSGEQIAEEAAAMGGNLGVNTSPDETTIGGDVLGEFAPRMIDLVADVVRNPAFPESEIERLKATLQRNLAVARSQAQTLAQERFNRLIYGDHPYGILLPEADDLAGFTVDRVRAFYDANVGAARAHLYVVGRFDAAAVEAAARAAFGGWPGGEAVAPRPAAATARPEVHLIDRPGAVQSSMYIGLPVIDQTDPDWVKLQVTNALLGGAFSSRITRNIREDKGYAYSPVSFISTRYRTGTWMEVADVETSVTGPALAEIFGEVERLAAEAPGADELLGVQNYVAGSFSLSTASRGGVLGQLRLLDLHGLPRTYLTDYVRNVYAVTPEDVRATAAEYLGRDRMLVVVVGDTARVRDALAAFGDVVAE